MGDTFMCTDNPILIKNTLNSPTIICVQRKAEKRIVTETDIIEANKLAFNDDIGTVTNRVTSMIETQAGFSPDSQEYQTLAYRIMCGQLYQQNTIDRAKGIIAKPMPAYWYSIRDNIIKDEDTEEIAQKKQFNRSIVAARKPYFMTYVYPTLKKQNNDYTKNNDYKAIMKFANYGINCIKDLYEHESKTSEMIKLLEYYERHIPVGHNPCVVNRICRIFEDVFDGHLRKEDIRSQFDYSILKSNTEYSKKNYNGVLSVYKEYQKRLSAFQKKTRSEKTDSFSCQQERETLINWFKKECEQICSNENELCDIVIDICYTSEKSKQFAWDICGNTMLKNLLRLNNGIIHYPQTAIPGEFEYCGKYFEMKEKRVYDAAYCAK